MYVDGYVRFLHYSHFYLHRLLIDTLGHYKTLILYYSLL